MNGPGELFSMFLVAALLSDFALEYLIGICPLIAVSRKLEAAAGFAATMVAVAPLNAVLAFVVHNRVLVPAGIDYVSLPVFVLLTLSVVYGLALLSGRWRPAVWRLIGPFLPLLAINCSLIGLVFLTVTRAGTVGAAAAYALGLAVGYGLLLLVIAQLRERLDVAEAPRAFRGIPLLLISIAVLSMALATFGAHAAPL